MSVVIRKREEKRNTPLYTFLGVAAIPLLLALLGGFFLGNAAEEDAGYWRQRYEVAAGQRDSLVAVQKESLEFAQRLANLRSELDKGAEGLLDDIPSDYEKEGNDWERDKDDFVDDWNDTIRVLKRSYLNQNHETDQFAIYVDLIETLIKTAEQTLDSKQRLESNNIPGLKEQIETLEENVEKLEDNVENKEGRIDDLRRELRECQDEGVSDEDLINDKEELEAKISDYKGTARELEGMIEEVQRLVNDIDNRTLGRGNVDNLKGDIRTKLSNMLTKCSTIR